MSSSARRLRRPSAGIAPWAHALPPATIAMAFGWLLILGGMPASSPSKSAPAPAAAARPASPPAPPDTTSPVVSIAADGTLSLGGETMIEEILQLHLLDLSRKGTRRVRIRAEPGASPERIGQIEKFCLDAGIPEAVREGAEPQAR